VKIEEENIGRTMTLEGRIQAQHGLRVMAGSGAANQSAQAQTNPQKRSITHIRQLAFLLVLLVLGVILLGLVLSVIKINQGTFIYTTDDAYIHLALSDQIRHGNYGINAGQHAAPDSSLLFPLLLVPASGTPLHPYLPLVLNCLSLFVTVFIMQRFLLHLRLAEDAIGVAVEAIALLLIAIGFNLIGVAFTGLEHSVHIAATAACIYGLALFLDNQKMPAWLPAVIVLAPLLRYEGLSLSIGIILIIALRGHWRTAAGAFALIAMALAGFSLFLVRMNLAPLPSSILVKSDIAANGVSGDHLGVFVSFMHNAFKMTEDPIGLILLLIGVAAAARCLQELPAKPWRWTSQGSMAFALLCLIGGHALAGHFGWVNRYEDYAILGTFLAGIYLLQNTIRKVLAARKIRLLYVTASFVALLIFSTRYVVNTLRVPLGANNIYEQQFQMHRFVNNYWKAPVAVNDLGLVSYHNPNFVLDLGGLASERARLLKATNAGADAYQALAANSGVHLVIVYDSWFPGQIPSVWKKVASMDLSRQRITAADDEVQFYATDADSAATLLPELQSFRNTLPPGVNLSIYK
jgi:hypothetical protein